MKIWNSYGSEHSANLVMIGRFKETSDAKEAKEAIERIEKYISQTGDDHRHATRYSEEMLDLLTELRVNSIQPAELEQFSFQPRLELKSNEIVLTTDEMDISAYLKVFVDKGARVEVYSAHDYNDTGFGR